MTGQDARTLRPAASVGGDSEAELRARIAELTEAVAARDTFIAVAAHELRNPMTPLVGQIDLLLAAIRAGRCSPEQVEMRLERLQLFVQRYLKRAEILLDVSRLTRGKLRLEPEPLDLAGLVREAVRAFAGAARQAGVPIRVRLPPQVRGTWDRLAVEQILENLLSNALKYGGHTPVEIAVEERGTNVRLQVRDHGGGIPAADRARVFQEFERAVGRGERRSGFGVGLWVVAQLVEAMEGTIMIDDAPGGGALFTVNLPRHGQSAGA